LRENVNLDRRSGLQHRIFCVLRISDLPGLMCSMAI
jgi:hypothetical protein